MIYQMIEEINKSLETGCYLVALMSALALPDICGKVEFPEMEKQTKHIFLKKPILRPLRLFIKASLHTLAHLCPLLQTEIQMNII